MYTSTSQPGRKQLACMQTEGHTASAALLAPLQMHAAERRCMQPHAWHESWSQHLRQLPAIVIGDNRICHAQTVDVAQNGFEPAGAGLVGKQHACVAHEGCDVRGLASCMLHSSSVGQ